ncbi:MAG: prepilin-type N-terminal cleavage/methylation domain-containing protein [Sedimentisphaerales bacterium]|nr:prepilin-type N-terminal cleavage/methylation domain-containing protein [Sedimentisphaerales bacterium]
MIYYLLFTIYYCKNVARGPSLVARREARGTRHETRKGGFTLVELLVALMVTAIVLGAVGSLAYAMSSAKDASDDTSLKQAQVRAATMRITELVHNAKLICATPTDAIVIWRADTDSNKKINSDELVYIQSNSTRDKIQLVQYNRPASYNTTFTLADIQSGAAKSTLDSACQKTTVDLVPQCSSGSVVLTVDNATIPKSKLVSIKFVITENNSPRTYQLCATAANPAFNLLTSANVIVSSDDD